MVPSRTWNKVFEVGFAKTGTVSLGCAFRILGLKTLGWSPELFEEMKKKNFAPMLKAARNHDAFVDGPWHQFRNYRLLDREFPGSRFIFLERDEASWMRSWERHFVLNVNSVPGQYTVSPEWFAANREKIVAGYHDRKRELKELFASRPRDLLFLNLCGGEGWEVLCPFLELPIPDEPFPYLHKSPEPEGVGFSGQKR